MIGINSKCLVSKSDSARNIALGVATKRPIREILYLSTDGGVG
jgi:hypothetical protein